MMVYASIVLGRIFFPGSKLCLIESKVEQQQNEELPKEIGILIIDLCLSMHYVNLHKSGQKLQNYDFQSIFYVKKDPNHSNYFFIER